MIAFLLGAGLDHGFLKWKNSAFNFPFQSDIRLGGRPINTVWKRVNNTLKEPYLRNEAQKGLKMQQGLLFLIFWSLHIQTRTFYDLIFFLARPNFQQIAKIAFLLGAG